jgi:hypothetical protein
MKIDTTTEGTLTQVQDLGGPEATMVVALVAASVLRVAPLEEALMTADDLSLESRAHLLDGIPEEFDALTEFLNDHLKPGATPLESVDLSNDVKTLADHAGLLLHEIPSWSDEQQRAAFIMLGELALFHWGLQRQGLAEAARVMLVLADSYDYDSLVVFTKALALTSYRVPEISLEAWSEGQPPSDPGLQWAEVARGISRGPGPWGSYAERGWYFWQILREAAEA